MSRPIFARHAPSILKSAPPLLCRAISSTSPTQSARPDVLVVGSGIAGLSAALAAAERGAKVTVLERFHGGGATRLSGGVVYAGGGTPYQKAAGFDDTPANMLAYLRAEVGTSGVVDGATLERFCDGSVERLAWLEKHGARFDSSLCAFKANYPKDGHYLYYSGNEQAYPFAKVAKPVPRGHRMVADGLMAGGSLWKALFASAQKLGIRFRPATLVEKLVTDSDGRVVGVECRSLGDHASPHFAKHKKLSHRMMDVAVPFSPWATKLGAQADGLVESHATHETIHASAVVLAAGGFSFNHEMREKHLPEFANVGPLGTPADDGSGIQLGQSVGGAVGFMDRMSAWRFIYSPSSLLEGVVVSREGQRISAEDQYGAMLSDAIVRRAGGVGFLIIDSAQMAKARKQLWKQLPPVILLQRAAWLYWDHKKAKTLSSLAEKTGISAPALEETIAAYNGAISNGTSDPVSKMPAYCTPIVKPPFFAMDVSMKRGGLQVSPGITLGGLLVDGKSGLVLDSNGRAVKGLYAAGRNAVGICSSGYVSGLSLADGVFSGRRAGEHATLEVGP